MPYTIRKQKCKQSDGDTGSYVLSYTDKSGKKHSNCHTSKKKAQGQIAAIEGQWEADEAGAEEEVMTERLLREMVRELLQENVNEDRKNKSSLASFLRTFLGANPGFIKKSAGRADVRLGLSTGDELTQEQIAAAIEKAGATVNNVIMPGEPDSKSGKYATHQIITNDGASVDVVFVTRVIKMPPRFDSRGVPTYSGSAEAMQINAMNDALRKVIGSSGKGVNIRLGSRPPLKNVGAIIQVGGNPKADAYFAPMKDGMVDRSSPMAYISLKNAGSPSGMQQWSGISNFMDYPEVSSFINDLKEKLAAMGSAGIMSHGPSFRSEFPVSEELALKACWGALYAPGKSGTQSVDMIYICSDSSVALRQVKGNTYEFTGGVSLYDGNLPPDGWAPYLYARKGERSDAGITGARIAIFPRDYRSSPVII